ncbi:MAG: hypothetical protein BWZ10_01323 [candidate division BRC1 bacterium ADurb.BinA364]|nr:MAG: hypothetical protein BWZ10_01323 [candidate division BRC1 bacterium ADurb.BinA364]
MPIVCDSSVFVSSVYSNMALMLDVAGLSPRAVWQNKNLLNHYSNAVLYNGRIFGSSGKDRYCALNCLDAATGSLLWSQQYRKPSDIQGNLGRREQTSLLVANQDLFVLTTYGDVCIVDTSSAEYKEKARMQILDSKYKAWCAPAYSDGYYFAKNAAGEIACAAIGVAAIAQAPSSRNGARHSSKFAMAASFIAAILWDAALLAAILAWCSSVVYYDLLLKKARGPERHIWRRRAFFLLGFPATLILWHKTNKTTKNG